MGAETVAVGNDAYGFEALALCGGVTAALLADIEKALDQTAKEREKDTLFNSVTLPTRRAAVALARNQAEKAIEHLRVTTPYDRVSTQAVYFRGLAYLRAKKGTEAAIEFQKIVDHKGAHWGQYYAVSFVGLARGAAMAGDNPRARKAYEDFFTLWKDADPDIPIHLDARKEYAALR